MLAIWQRAHAVWPGLSSFLLPADPTERDRYIVRTLSILRAKVERDLDPDGELDLRGEVPPELESAWEIWREIVREQTARHALEEAA